jgi:hypothetical protein
MVRRLPILILTLPVLPSCLDGPEGLFVQLYGRVTTEQGAPAAGVEVSIASPDGAAILETHTDEQGWYSVMVLVSELHGHQIELQLDGEGYATTRAWVELDLIEGESKSMPSHPPQLWSSWSRQLPALQVALDAASGQAEGSLVDAATGLAPVELVGDQERPLVLEIELREGWNAPDTEPVVTTIATGRDADHGRWSVSGLPPGAYTARVWGDGGFTGARFPVLLGSGAQDEFRACVTRDLASDEIRATLVWGGYPADLNLHVTGPRGSVTPGESQFERFHVWAQEPYHPANASDIHDRVVTMDRLADDGFGPEAATIHEMRADGPYRFSVYDHSNGGSSGSEALGGSEAMVQLWIGSRTPAFFQVTPGEAGSLWKAAEWDSDLDILYRFAEIGSAEDESDVTAF